MTQIKYNLFNANALILIRSISTLYCSSVINVILIFFTVIRVFHGSDIEYGTNVCDFK